MSVRLSPHKTVQVYCMASLWRFPSGWIRSLRLVHGRMMRPNGDKLGGIPSRPL